MNLRLLALGSALVLGACGGKATVREPAKLKDIEAPVLRLQTSWTASAGEGSNGQFSGLRLDLQDDALYSASVDGGVFAFARDNGRTLWRVDTEARIISGPSVSGDLVLVGTLDGEVIALKRADGSERWRQKLSSEVLGPPVAEGDRVVARSVDGRVFGLEAAAGERVWTFDRVVPNLVLRGNSAPLMIQGRAFVGMDNGRLASLRASDGQPLWEQAVAVPSGRTELERLTDIDAELVDADDCLLAASFGGEVACLSPASGEVLWRRSIRSYAGMAVSGDKVIVTDEAGVVWGLDLATGAAAWKQEELQYRKLSPPTVFGKYAVVADFEGYLHLIDPSSGQIVARTRAGSEPILSPMAASEDRLYVMNVDGRVAAVSARP